MRSILSLFLGVLVSLGLFLAFVYAFLPNQYHLKASVTLERTPQEVFAIVNNLERWAVWAHADLKGINQDFFGAKQGEGAVYEWRSEGNYGRIEIVESVPNERVRFEAYLPDGISSEHIFSIRQHGGQTELVWEEVGNFGWDPRMRLYAWLTGLEAKLSAQYTRTLAGLRQS